MTNERKARIHNILYSTDSREELAQRIVALEELVAENAKLRELVYDMLQDEERGHNDELTFDEHVERANELGVRLDG